MKGLPRKIMKSKQHCHLVEITCQSRIEQMKPYILKNSTNFYKEMQLVSKFCLHIHAFTVHTDAQDKAKTIRLVGG